MYLLLPPYGQPVKTLRTNQVSSRWFQNLSLPKADNSLPHLLVSQLGISPWFVKAHPDNKLKRFRHGIIRTFTSVSHSNSRRSLMCAKLSKCNLATRKRFRLLTLCTLLILRLAFLDKWFSINLKEWNADKWTIKPLSLQLPLWKRP